MVSVHSQAPFFPTELIQTQNLLQCGAPLVISWFISPSNYSYLLTIVAIVIGVMFTNLAIVRGPHFVGIWSFVLDAWHQ